MIQQEIDEPLLKPDNKLQYDLVENSKYDSSSQNQQTLKKNKKIKVSQKKKSKTLLATSNTDTITYKPSADNKIYDLANRLIRSDDKYKVLQSPYGNDGRPQPINQSTYPFIYSEKIKIVQDPDNVWKIWWRNQIPKTVELIDKIYKPIQISQELVKTSMISSSSFLQRAGSNHYWNKEKIRRDLNKLFSWTYFYRVTDLQGLSYLYQLWENIDSPLQKTEEAFNFDKQKDMDNLFQLNTEFKMEVDRWPYIPSETRKYEVLTEYETNPPDQRFCQIIQDKLKTEKIPVICNKNCVCFNPEQFGNFSLENQTWNSECPNRSKRIECQTHQDTEEKCLNQSITQKKFKQLGLDVEETLCWGIDIYTRGIIYFCLPTVDNELKQKFISYSLMKACNLLKENGYNLKAACEYILSNTQHKKQIDNDTKKWIFTISDRKFAKALLSAMVYDEKKQVFRAHSKGVGVICKKFIINKLQFLPISPNGIKNNELLIQYIGEIYQPWRWFEKQDFIKKKMKDDKQKDILPDFYNIQLEMHKDDPKGLDILFVDPINKGNYSSRLSHSCDPNCGTITTIAEGKYTIGMYALKMIEFGEELSFDYCSTTESKQEYRQALCLCGQEKCRIRYLDLNLSKENNIMDKIHCFLERNSCLLKACTSQNPIDFTLTNIYNIKSSVLDGCPDWLIRWTSNILEFVQKEQQIYIQEQENLKIHKNMDIIKFLAQQYTESRIQNLIITLDKIKYFLNGCHDNSPPLILFTEQELVQETWGDWTENQQNTKKPNLITEMDGVFRNKRSSRQKQELVYAVPQFAQCISIITKTKKLIDQEKSPQIQWLLTRMMFLCISHVLFQISAQTNVHTEAFAVILYLMAFTYSYFRPYEYEGFQSVKFDIHEIEWCKIGNGGIGDKNQEDNSKKVKKPRRLEQRGYSSQFVWGQLIGWFKQTVANPQASLSQDRRGTLSYPSFQASFIGAERSFPFQEQTQQNNKRAYFLNHLIQKPSYMWPPEQASWSYKNQYKLYGTVLFEYVFSRDKLGNDFLKEVITNTESDINTKILAFAEMDKRYYAIDPATTIGFFEKNLQEFVGESDLKLDNKLSDVAKNQIYTKKLIKERKQQQFMTQVQENINQEQYFNKLSSYFDGFEELQVQKRRKIEKFVLNIFLLKIKIKNPEERQFLLDYSQIFSFDFSKQEKQLVQLNEKLD